MARKIWGVDSAARVTEILYSCVTSNFGSPKYWGRYLTDVPNVSDGLTREEISFLRTKGTKVLPIYNVFRTAIGYDKGQIAARNAVFHARRLGFPTDTVLFANVENFFEVDSAWIRGWVESLLPTGYRPGIYHDPVKGEFSAAYCQAVQENNQVASQVILWSAEPEPGVTKERNAPRFNPKAPNCQGNVWLWQYGRDSAQCSIDTNLADERILKYLC
ncbi:glycoside hydrolase domain-containing protein [Bacillus salitolerans]|uniref:Glycoside hydrolase domain-containing protein n=1 Tax=Bacillus salitolerans TaxID=1437434 RepID=A0ABW4LKD9_9BACI